MNVSIHIWVSVLFNYKPEFFIGAARRNYEITSTCCQIDIECMAHSCRLKMELSALTDYDFHREKMIDLFIYNANKANFRENAYYR